MASEGFKADDLNKLLVESQDQIIASVKAKLVERLSSNYEWQLVELINSQVKEFYAAECAPIIKQNLLDARGEIVAGATAAAAQIGLKLGEAMVEQVTENLSASWKSSQVLKALFA